MNCHAVTLSDIYRMFQRYVSMDAFLNSETHSARYAFYQVPEAYSDQTRLLKLLLRRKLRRQPLNLPVLLSMKGRMFTNRYRSFHILAVYPFHPWKVVNVPALANRNNTRNHQVLPADWALHVLYRVRITI